jgi:hypothetical protein
VTGATAEAHASVVKMSGGGGQGRRRLPLWPACIRRLVALSAIGFLDSSRFPHMLGAGYGGYWARAAAVASGAGRSSAKDIV